MIGAAVWPAAAPHAYGVLYGWCYAIHMRIVHSCTTAPSCLRTLSACVQLQLAAVLALHSSAEWYTSLRAIACHYGDALHVLASRVVVHPQGIVLWTPWSMATGTAALVPTVVTATQQLCLQRCCYGYRRPACASSSEGLGMLPQELAKVTTCSITLRMAYLVGHGVA